MCRVLILSKAGKKGGGRGGKSRNDDVFRSDIVEVGDMNNERFNKYYKEQNILPDDEWNAFLGSLRQVLPTTFRVAGSRQCVNPPEHTLHLTHSVPRTARLLNDTIKTTHVPHLAGVVFEGEAVAPPKQIPWCVSVSRHPRLNSQMLRYPEGLAWQFNVSKRVLRKSPEFKKFHNFLVFETEVVRNAKPRRRWAGRNDVLAGKHFSSRGR